MTEALGILFFNSGVSRGCLVDRYWKVVDIKRAAVRARWIPQQRYGKVYSEITDECTCYEIFKGSCGLHLPRQRPKSVLQFKSDGVFDQQNSELVSQNAGYKPTNVEGLTKWS